MTKHVVTDKLTQAKAIEVTATSGTQPHVTRKGRQHARAQSTHDEDEPAQKALKAKYHVQVPLRDSPACQHQHCNLLLLLRCCCCLVKLFSCSSAADFD